LFLIYLTPVANLNYDNTYFFVFNPAQNAIVPNPVAPYSGKPWPYKRLACASRVFQIGYTFPQKPHNPFLRVYAQFGQRLVSAWAELNPPSQGGAQLLLKILPFLRWP
jgi:hypothetical protein